MKGEGELCVSELKNESGVSDESVKCPKCKGINTKIDEVEFEFDGLLSYYCLDCGNKIWLDDINVTFPLDCIKQVDL